MHKTMHHSFRTKLFCAVLAVTLLSVGVAVLYGKNWLEENQMQAARERLARECRLAAVIWEHSGHATSPQAGLEDLAETMSLPGARFTLMDGTGNVLADTFDTTARHRDNHADRPEVVQAIQEGAGIAIRPSDTVGVALVYAATRLSDGQMLRLAQPLHEVRQIIDNSLSVFGQIGLVAVLLSLVLASLLSLVLKRSLGRMIAVVEAISLGNYQRRLYTIPGREFEPLANAVNRMARNIANHIRALDKADRVRRDFVANVSHELRTPLTAIQGSAETVASLETGAECRRFIEIILKNTRYLSGMVADLLTLARLENAEEAVALVPADPHEALAQTVDLTRALLQSRNQRLDVAMPEHCEVQADPQQLVCLLRNLIENASRHAPCGSTIRVRASCAGAIATFRIVDDGPGIAKEEQERVFERFYQVERHRRQGTSGLGLAICRHIVQRHNGRIHVESPASDGATAFVFTLNTTGEHREQW